MRAIHLVPAAAVLVALAAIGGVAQLDHPAAPRPAASATVTRQVAVTSAARACPPAPGGGSAPVTLLGGRPGATGAPGQGSQGDHIDLTALPPAGQTLRPASPVRAQSPGVVSLLTLPAGTVTGKKGGAVAQGWSVTGNGVMAQSMEAELADSTGMAAVRCGAPGSDLWFVGPGKQNGVSKISVSMMNVDSLAASVDVTVITDAGQSQAGNNDTGITVPPHQTVTESLSSVASGSSVVAIEVHTSIGRVVADVSEGSSASTTTDGTTTDGTTGTTGTTTGGTTGTTTDGTTTDGTASASALTWLPVTAAPSTRLVIPGVPPSGSAAGLFIADPGDSSAKVTVTAITPQQKLRPFGTQSVDLPGQSASYVALSPLGGINAALVITSNVPVVAGVVVPGAAADAATGAAATAATATAATAPISQQAVVAGNISGSGLAASVVLTAPGTAARVRLTEIAPASHGGGSVTASQVVPVKAGRTQVAAVTAPKGAKHRSAFAVVITPLAGSGPVYAARVETMEQSTVVSIIPAASALTTMSLPPVSNSYNALSP
ncbi:MAG TPA: DUF5719 family protein [Streptosporangiaceae bacterium]|nr:DUF5719 family protein [Streptosporangiaceae bacterium]